MGALDEGSKRLLSEIAPVEQRAFLVGLGRIADHRQLFFPNYLHDATLGAHDNRTVRDQFAGRDKSAGANATMTANPRAIQYERTVTDQRLVRNLAAMQEYLVSDCYVSAYQHWQVVV